MSKDLELDELKDSVNVDDEPILRERQLDETNEENVTSSELEPVYDIPVKVSAVLGKTKMKVNQLLKLNKGAIIELDKKVGENIDIYVNNSLVARGEVVVVDDKLGVTMSEIVKTTK
ncbi:MAG: flagellar motor switch protein FliN [Alphaproteobacteria bacterium]